MDTKALTEKVREFGHRHKSQLFVVMVAMLYMGATASAAVNFTEAGQTIQAVTDDLIDPIANLVIGLIKLFVALFVIAMLGAIFTGVGNAVKGRI